MLRCALLSTSLAVAIFLLSLLPSDADGCAAIGRAGEPPIRIADESAIIIWDPVKKIEHFIRHATFDTKSPDIGFLVPTPTMPKLPLAEVGNTAFNIASFWTRPKIVTRTEYSFDPILCCYGFSKRAMLSAPLGEGDSVRVLHEQKVGGFQAAVLEADNTEDLSKWLYDNGYSNDPELQSWLAPYVIEKWKITAFKIMQDPKTGQTETTKPVRMSFATDKPFFPYREPEGKAKIAGDQGSDARMLRVHFVSTARMEGKLGNAAWHAKVVWADQLTDEQRKQLAKETGLPEDDVPVTTWMTTLEDTASPRPGKDEVYFEPAKEQSPIHRPDWVKINEIWIPGDLIFIGLLFVGLVVVLTVRKCRRK